MVDFLHLTLPVIEEQTDRLKGACGKVPCVCAHTTVVCKPLAEPTKEQIFRFVTRDIFHGNAEPHPLSHKVTLKASTFQMIGSHGLGEGSGPWPHARLAREAPGSRWASLQRIGR